MHAHILISNDQEKINEVIQTLKKKLAVSPFTYHEIFPAPSIGIKDIQDLLQGLKFSSFDGSERLIVLHDFHKATSEAQNAFLKSLEEPPDKTTFLLIAESSNMILPTILSRCLLQTHRDQKSSMATSNEMHNTLKRLSTSSPGQRLLAIEQYSKTREEALQFLSLFIRECEKLLRNDGSLKIPKIQLVTFIPKIEKAREALTRNVNVKATLGVLALSFPSS